MAVQPDMNVSSPQRPRGVRRLARGQAPLRGALTWLVLAGGSAQMLAAEPHTTMMVNANVLPVARIQMATGVPQLQVSAADVALGYVDAPRPLLLRIESNSRTGFALDVSPLSPWCTAVALQGFDSEVVVDGAGGTVVQRWPDSKSRSLALRARFKLAATAQPGLYAWPLQLSARPL